MELTIEQGTISVMKLKKNLVSKYVAIFFFNPTISREPKITNLNLKLHFFFEYFILFVNVCCQTYIGARRFGSRRQVRKSLSHKEGCNSSGLARNRVFCGGNTHSCLQRRKEKTTRFSQKGVFEEGRDVARDDLCDICSSGNATILQ